MASHCIATPPIKLKMSGSLALRGAADGPPGDFFERIETRVRRLEEMCAHRGDVRTGRTSPESDCSDSSGQLTSACAAVDAALSDKALCREAQQGGFSQPQPTPKCMRRSCCIESSPLSSSSFIMKIMRIIKIIIVFKIHYYMYHIQMTVLFQDIFNLPCGPASTVPWTLGHDSRHTDNEQTRKPSK